MTSVDSTQVVVATRSPLLRDGLVAALRQAGVDASMVSDHTAQDAVWLVDDSSMRRARERGAKVLLLREGDASGPGSVSLDGDLQSLLDALARGDAVASADVAPASSSPLDDLTEREREIVAHVARGLTNQQVATELGITANTVRTHLQNVMAKLAVTNRRALAALVNEAGT